MKVTHTTKSAGFGLKAICPIPAGTFIMETCSSMSLGVAPGPGPSVIQATSNQLGPIGPRLILGPFRLVNHDCKPNSQVSSSSIFDTFWTFFPQTSPVQIFPIQGTYAYVIATIQPIEIGEEITAKYQESGYYGACCLCRSCTGRDTSDLSVLKPSHSVQKQLGDTLPNVQL